MLHLRNIHQAYYNCARCKSGVFFFLIGLTALFSNQLLHIFNDHVGLPETKMHHPKTNDTPICTSNPYKGALNETLEIINASTANK
mmetsp:Transcript_38998/g.47527  ORF Transcript_38998/g.47527 Transcript_38998/m.47527 type:complete len:86 (-) Transcript_38998:226-483(-)